MADIPDRRFATDTRQRLSVSYQLVGFGCARPEWTLGRNVGTTSIVCHDATLEDAAVRQRSVLLEYAAAGWLVRRKER